MKVSVVVPVYNVEKYLKRCLDSIVNQTYKNIEIILVNDGSKDNSRDICEEYEKNYENVSLIDQANGGLSAARNTGLKHINGEAVTFVDSDDWLELDAIEYYVDSMKKYNVDMVVTNNVRTKDYQEKTPQPDSITEEVLTQEEYAKKFFKINGNSIEYYAWSKLYKREIMEGVEFPVGLFAEDVLGTFRYMKNAQNIFHSNRVTYNYFINDSGLTAKFGDKDFDLEKIWDTIVEESKEYENKNFLKYAVINRKRIDFNLLCRIALAENKKENFKKYDKKITELLKSIKENKQLLLEYLPFSRKVILILFTLNYSLGSKVLNILSKISGKTL
ncbi:glycosyltransferase [uncultured Gemella sp.]|uniref:glycosyltransferase n=1 Tax=uncultured Gemella sp. TaxID=254352 RepID=UPI0028E4837E|nr:glycosyltransferase [uncultured Gemella sp.]